MSVASLTAHLSVDDWPRVIVEGSAVKLAITGFGFGGAGFAGGGGGGGGGGGTAAFFLQPAAKRNNEPAIKM